MEGDWANLVFVNIQSRPIRFVYRQLRELVTVQGFLFSPKGQHLMRISAQILSRDALLPKPSQELRKAFSAVCWTCFTEEMFSGCDTAAVSAAAAPRPPLFTAAVLHLQGATTLLFVAASSSSSSNTMFS